MYTAFNEDYTTNIFCYLKDNSTLKIKRIKDTNSSNSIIFNGTDYNVVLDNILNYFELLDYRIVILHKASFSKYSNNLSLTIQYSAN